MIFVSVGSSTIPFDRLLQAVDALRLDERLVVQHGPSAIRPRRAECIDVLSHSDFLELVRDARAVVTHGGVGSVMTCLGERKRPIVVPRCSSLGEAVDDHQVSFARRAAELGFATLVEELDELPRALSGDPTGHAAEFGKRPSPIEIELRSYIEQCLGPAVS